MNLTALLHSVHGPWVYAVIGVSALLESAAFVGLIVPGETVMLLGGVLAAAGQADLIAVTAVAIAGAVAGDQIGYSLGRVLGPSLRTGRLGRRLGQDRWTRAEELVARRGGPAVFLGRWIGFLRAVVPAAAGAAGLPRTVFLAWNAVGGALWATAVVGAGYLAGASWATVQHWMGTGALLAGVVAVVLVVAVAVLRRRRRRDRGPAPRHLRRRPRAHPALLAGAGLGLVLAVAFGELSDNVTDHTGITAEDRPTLSWFLAHRSPGATTAAQVISTVSDITVMAALALVVAAVLAWRRRWLDTALVLATVGGAGALVEIGKLTLARPRPPLVDQLTVETNASFPSGHTVAATAVIGVLTALLLPRLRRRTARVSVLAVAVALVGLVGVSRLYLGVHWASDVLGGWVVGGFWLTVCLTAAAAWSHHSARSVRTTPPPRPRTDLSLVDLDPGPHPRELGRAATHADPAAERPVHR